MNATKTTRQLQAIVDKTRKQFGPKSVMVYQDNTETTISFSLALCGPCVWGLGGLSDQVQNAVGGCDSGTGFGWRDLQLCRKFPDLI